MKTLFIAAKYFAMKENAPHITLEHFKKALSNFEITDSKAKELFLKKLNLIQESTPSTLITQIEIDSASKYKKIEFSEEVKELKKTLEVQGFSFNSPIAKLVENTTQSFDSLKNIHLVKEGLSQKIYAQDTAIEVLTDRLKEMLYKGGKNAPQGIFFFVGPPATGKTYLAELLHESLPTYGFKLFSMSAYQGSNQNFALMGLSKGYSNAAEGKLSEFVKTNPKSICVFDEIEKAHPEVQNVFLDIMARGKARDEFTQEEIDFTNTILIFTSNLGQEVYSNHTFIDNLTKDYHSAQSIILEAIGDEKYSTSDGGTIPKLKPEFLSRVAQGDVVLFNKLTMDAYVRIGKEALDNDMENLQERLPVKLTCKDLDLLLKLMVLSLAPMVDARRVKSILSYKVLDPITDYLLSHYETLEGDSNNPLHVKIELAKDVEDTLASMLSSDSKSNDKLLHNLFRRNQTLKLSHEITHNKSTLTLTYTSATLTKLPKSKDYGQEEGSFTFDIPEISFSDIAGHNKVKKRLQEIVKLLVSPKQMESFNVDLPRGMLLYGPPGTGKTMIAKAFAHEADLPFIATTGTQMLDSETKTMRSIFKRAREYAPSIVFIDEIDAIGRRDGSRMDAIINQFLTELNGFGDKAEEQVFVIAATNLKEKLDPAILRSGRIDLHVKIAALDKEARGYFIDKMLKKPSIGKIDKDKLINFSAGMSGADLEKVSREASFEAIRKGLEGFNEEILLEQINSIKYGERLTDVSLEKLISATAYHEAGHAVISHMLMPTVKIEQITVTPRHNALGFVSYNQDESIGNLTLSTIKSRICVAYAGRIAQIRYMGEENGCDSGASSDISMATRLAYYAIAELGMSKSLGYINLEALNNSQKGETIQNTIMQETLALLHEQQKVTEDLVQKHWKSIDRVATHLIANEFIDEDEFLELLQ